MLGGNTDLNTVLKKQQMIENVWDLYSHFYLV